MTKIGKLLTTTALACVAAAGLHSTVSARDLVRIATMPAGAEVTGLSTNKAGELFLNSQHPGGKNVFGDDVQPASNRLCRRL